MPAYPHRQQQQQRHQKKWLLACTKQWTIVLRKCLVQLQSYASTISYPINFNGLLLQTCWFGEPLALHLYFVIKCILISHCEERKGVAAVAVADTAAVATTSKAEL